MRSTRVTKPPMKAATARKAAHPGAGTQEVGDWLVANSTAGVLTVDRGSPNQLLYTGGL